MGAIETKRDVILALRRSLSCLRSAAGKVSYEGLRKNSAGIQKKRIWIPGSALHGSLARNDERGSFWISTSFARSPVLPFVLFSFVPFSPKAFSLMSFDIQVR